MRFVSNSAPVSVSVMGLPAATSLFHAAASGVYDASLVSTRRSLGSEAVEKTREVVVPGSGSPGADALRTGPKRSRSGLRRGVRHGFGSGAARGDAHVAPRSPISAPSLGAVRLAVEPTCQENTAG